jgi:GntR family transcriptional regulator/MocR family aminotransferase
MIISGQYTNGDKIPSVRKTAEMLGVSVTTVKNAYFDLCTDGYIISHEKSGFYVSYSMSQSFSAENDKSTDTILYNMSGGAADADSFDFALWQRYIKSALRQSERLLTYSDVQGEYDLRSAISSYIKEKRNVAAPPDRIVIGAGVYPLLQILSTLLDSNMSVSFPDKSFIQGMSIFEDRGYEVFTRYKDADIIYVSPSHMTRWGDVMPIKRRLELVDYSVKKGSLVIEDDFENEFLYNTKPTPSLYALGKGNVIYIGSFSAMLLPGIRISFMVLTKELSDKFRESSYKFSQTAGKTEQIALARYISDGCINSQTRKIRRLYTQKTRAFSDILKKKLPDANIVIGENQLQIILKADFTAPPDIFEKNGLSVYTESLKDNIITLILSPSAIPNSELENAAELLKKSIF